MGMENGQNEVADVEDDLLTAETGADISLVPGRTRVQRGHDHADADDESECRASDRENRREIHQRFPPESISVCATRSFGAGMAWKSPPAPSTRRTIAPCGMTCSAAAFAR